VPEPVPPRVGGATPTAFGAEGPPLPPPGGLPYTIQQARQQAVPLQTEPTGGLNLGRDVGVTTPYPNVKLTPKEVTRFNTLVKNGTPPGDAARLVNNEALARGVAEAKAAQTVGWDDVGQILQPYLDRGLTPTEAIAKVTERVQAYVDQGLSKAASIKKVIAEGIK
jgi:hypothetical protein